jgi:hypothetical protein
LLTLPGRLTTVCKAIEIGMAEKRRAPADAASQGPATAVDGDLSCEQR